jgi:SnoaL-like protein
MGNFNLENRIQVLEDIEAIKKLKSGYAEACDRVFCKNDLKPLLKIFAEDAVWDVGDFGRYVGKEEIKGCLSGIRETFVFSMHYFVNPRIEIHGDQASGRWDMWCLYTDVEGQDLVAAGTEDDKYQKIHGEWFLSDMKLATQFFSPLSEGWHKVVMEKYGTP